MGTCSLRRGQVGHCGKALPCSGDRLLSDLEAWQEVALCSSESGHSGRSRIARYMFCGSQMVKLSEERADSRTSTTFWAESITSKIITANNTCHVLGTVSSSLLVLPYLILGTNPMR